MLGVWCTPQMDASRRCVWAVSPDLLLSLRVTTFQCHDFVHYKMTLANHVFLEIDGNGFHAFAANFLSRRRNVSTSFDHQ